MDVGKRRGEAMKAVAVNHFGELPEVVEVTTPTADPGQVLVRLVAASINPMDAKLASGEWRPAPALFPMVLGVDGAGYVEATGDGEATFAQGDKVFGQLFIPPIGSTGTYAEYVAVSAQAPLTWVPDGLDLALAASAPTAGGTGLSLIDVLDPLQDQVVLLIGAGGGVGTFASQFAVNAGASVIANINADDVDRISSYGVSETVVRSEISVMDAVRASHPDGVDALIDLVSDAAAFARTSALVRPGGVAVTTQYVADLEALRSSGVRGVNFALRMTRELIERVGRALAEHAVQPPPISRITLEDVPPTFGTQSRSRRGCKTVIIL
jgi:NADPH:quinone reductase